MNRIWYEGLRFPGVVQTSQNNDVPSDLSGTSGSSGALGQLGGDQDTMEPVVAEAPNRDPAEAAGL